MPAPIQSSDLQKYFENTFSSKCIPQAIVVPPAPEKKQSRYFGEWLPTPKIQVFNVLSCTPLTKGLPHFIAHIASASSQSPVVADLNCSFINGGLMVCRAKGNDFSFVLDKKEGGAIKMTYFHEVSYSNTMTPEARSFLRLMLQGARDAVYTPASW